LKILALETSAKSVSAALTEDGVILASCYQNNGLTHSRTLMPLVDSMLRNAGLTAEQADLIAVAAGPGSFTGLRIGVSAAKGLAWAMEKPCCAVSTLEAMAQNLRHMDATVICAMDARRQQVYNAVFSAENGTLRRLSPDRAISLEQLAEEIKTDEKVKIVVGDGAKLCYTYLEKQGIPCRMAPPALVMQNAVGVAQCAAEMASRGETVSAHELVPVYLRLSQAERERLAKGLKITLD
jgi:tRNA threonylcarbamoyladenosine biosynthesis protein TsaB